MLAIVATAIWLVAAQSASAVQSDIYDNHTKCPTGSAAMNDPGITGASCASALVKEGFLKVGNFAVPITTPMHLQFAFLIVEPKQEGESEHQVVAGSTTIDTAPFVVPNPFYRPPSPPAAQAPPAKKKGKSHRKHRKHGKKKGKGGKHKKHRKKRKKKAPPPVPVVVAPTPPPSDPFVKATVEPAGDLRDLNLGALFGDPRPLFRLPIKLHLESAGLGPACYVGTDSNPIVLAAGQSQPPTSGDFVFDPNGFAVENLFTEGGGLEDKTFAVPAASGCGPIDPATQQGSMDSAINGFLGLPTAPGASRAVFDSIRLDLAGALNDGAELPAGEELQAAFDAAR
ncbi:MAG TPA: hypothetical protein VFX45_00550 [Solirubrobacterales bacterium]|nr:hypothetical protein [Solirubrobacterales bacterium]